MSRFAIIVLILANASAATVRAQSSQTTVKSPQVRVELANGRSFTAAVDARTTQQRLWLRFDRQSAALYRPVPWGDVTSAEYDGQTYSADELRQLTPQLRSQRSSRTSGPIVEPSPRDAATDAGGKTYSQLAQEALVCSPKVRSIAVDAHLANWDGDVEVDGIALWLTAIDSFGAPAAIDGTLNVELYAERRARLDPPPPQRREDLKRYGAWTKMLRVEDGGEQLFLLPFQAVHPDFDAAISSYGLLHAKLAVPGHGVFEASVADLRIRPISRNRDRLQDSSSRRFRWTETTGRSKSTGQQP